MDPAQSSLVRPLVPPPPAAPALRLVPAALAALLLVFGPGLAHADWPVPRADGRRTGAATGTSNLSAPVPYWRYFLGGAISARGALFLDVDSDSAGEVVLIAGGKLMARERTDQVVWETPVLGLTTIVGMADLNGDGVDEIAVHGRNQVFLVQPATGAILWEEPADDFGFLGGARLGDLDGDGIADLFVQECGCCRINNGNTGFVYRFAGAGGADGGDGFGAAERLWTLPSVRCGGSRAMTMGDFDGDGRTEVTLGENRRILILDGATGAEQAATDDIGERAGESLCLPVSLPGPPPDDDDGDDGSAQALICVQSNNPFQDPAYGHRAFLLRYQAADAGTAARLDLVWQRDLGALNSRVSVGADPVRDLDGDGAPELVASGVDADGTTAITYILDAATGAVRAELRNQRVVGTIAVMGTLVLTAGADGLSAWTLTAVGADRQWTLPGQRALLETDWDAALRSAATGRVLLLDVTGDGVPELITAADAADGAAGDGGDAGEVLHAHDLAVASAGIAPAQVARHPLDASASVLAAWALPPLPGEPGAQLLVAASNGIMHVLDRARLSGEPPADGARAPRGVRFGGYLPRGDWRNLHLTPVTGDLGAGADSLVMADSRGMLVRIDAHADGRDASLAAPPVARWEIADTTGPVLLPGPPSDSGTGPARIACRQRDPDGAHLVAVLDAAGQALWRADVGGEVLSDLVLANLGGDQPEVPDLPDLPDLIVQWGRPSDLLLQHRAYDGSTGAVLWDAEPQQKGGTRFPAGGAVVDWDGDGIDDFIHQYYDTQVLSGADGSVLAESQSSPLVYFMPTVLDLDGDAGQEVVLHGGFSPVRVMDDDLSTPLWVSADDNRPYPYGAIATTCEDRVPRLIEGSLMHPATLEITPLAGADLGSPHSLVLAGGAAHADEAAAREAGAFLGQLTSTSLHADLTGAGRPVAVVGSEDGWLYAVDACAGTLTFAVPLGAAVGAVAFGDTNGDGLDEILAAAGDGYLYALAQPPVGAPTNVVDLDPGLNPGLDPVIGPGAPAGDADVDRIPMGERMAAAWDAVDGADGYRVAVVEERTGRIVSQPAWQETGPDTRAVVSGLTLAAGETYVFAVQALADGAPSPDGMSDGVIVEGAPDVEPPDPDEPGTMPVGGCGCRSSDPAGPAGGGAWLLAAGVALALLRRRRLRV